MWFVTDPEELRNYQCKTSLKKLKENLVQRYSGSLKALFQDNLWYTGISSNPILSLAAHGVDTAQFDRFACWVIPVKFARELKAAALALEQFQHAFDDASDYVAGELP